MEPIHTHELLAGLHEALSPETYLEIGVAKGQSLSLARAPAIAIDPEPRLKQPVPASIALFEETSDAYFDRPRPLEPLDGRPPSLALIDGMHLVDYVLRDFINVERHAHPTSVVVVDDIFPRTVDEASRERVTRFWAGDVYKLRGILAQHRPDLLQLALDTRPTGMLLVLGLDPANRVLGERYEEIVADAVVPDPQPVPADVLRRKGAYDPEAVLSSSLWPYLREARVRDAGRDEVLTGLRETVRGELRPMSRGQRWARRVRARTRARRAQRRSGS